MNRRKFLKRIVTVAAGAVAVPTVVKNMIYKSKPSRERYIWRVSRICNPYNFDPPNMPSKYPKHPLGTLYKASDGSVYVYVKHTEHKMLDGRVFYTFTQENKYANNRKNDLHYQT